MSALFAVLGFVAGLMAVLAGINYGKNEQSHEYASIAFIAVGVCVGLGYAAGRFS